MVAESIKVFLDGQFWLDPEVFRPDQVAFARRMDMEHVDYGGGSRETKRNIVADSDKHMMNGCGVILKRPILASKKRLL
jgi:hypothetical protein